MEVQTDASNQSDVRYPRIPLFAPNHSRTTDRNVVQHWGFFSRAELSSARGRLLMLDIDFGRDCSLRCPTCFRRRNAVDCGEEADLSYEELVAVVEDARSLGLTTVKICGAGEPLENPLLLRFARLLTSWGVGLSVFTKAHVLGDDNLAARVFESDGIRSAKQLAHALFELRTSLLVSFQSFRPTVQDKLVGGVSGYTQKRNRAVELLCKVGFNRTAPTRIAFCANPITKLNYREIYTAPL